MTIDHHSVDAERNILRFTASAGRRRRGVPDDVLLKVRVVVRRLSAEHAS